MVDSNSKAFLVPASARSFVEELLFIPIRNVEVKQSSESNSKNNIIDPAT